MRRETNYFRWNPEARALLVFQLAWFGNMFLLELWLSVLHVVLILVHAAVMTVWSFSYLNRAGNQKRERYAFYRVWGPPVAARCPVCKARGDEACDAGLHG